MSNMTDSRCEVTPLTMAILSKEHSNGNRDTIVMEELQEYSVQNTPTKMIEHACAHYGKSLNNLQSGTKHVSKITHKAPIAIDSTSGMYFFPTTSPNNKNCSWLSHTHIQDIRQIDSGSRTEVTFKNNQRIILNVSFVSFRNQLHRTAQFRFYLDDRRKLIQEAIMSRMKYILYGEK